MKWTLDHSGEQFQKDAVSVNRFTGFMCKELGMIRPIRVKKLRFQQYSDSCGRGLNSYVCSVKFAWHAPGRPVRLIPRGVSFSCCKLLLSHVFVGSGCVAGWFFPPFSLLGTSTILSFMLLLCVLCKMFPLISQLAQVTECLLSGCKL